MTNNSRHLTQGDELKSSDLKEKWVETLTFYDQMIDGGHQLRPIRFLVRHIIDKGYDNYYFPGTSLFNLLISIPIDNKVSYTKTLKVEVDQLRNIVKFDYRDWTGLSQDNTADLEKSLKWSDRSQLTESCDTFEYFINTIEEWNPKTK
jgi:hypothetical protein